MSNRNLISLIILVILLTCLATPSFASNNSISWTEDELSFLEEHPVIRLGVDPGFVPFEFIDGDGEYKGIAADYLELMSQKTGLQFEFMSLAWPEAYDMALVGDVDALPAIGKTDDREKHFLFSEPYYYYKRVIVTRDIDTHISGIEDLEGLAVAVQRNSSHHSYLLSYPNINLSLYDSVEAALTNVVTGTEKAFVGNLATTNYMIRSHGLTNLRFVSFEPEKQQALYFAVRKDWPELVSIFNKAMATITESEKLAINKKWIDLDTDVDYGPIIRILIIVATLSIVIWSVSFFWIVRLRREVQQRKQIQLSLEEAKREAEEANEFKSSFMARMSHEIRTPLNTIIGMSYLLKRTEVSLTQGMYIDRITQASNNMLSIINDILDFSKIEAGKIDLDISSFSMDMVIQNVVNIVSYKIDEQKIGFQLSKDPQIPNWFFGDAKRIQQILVNVLNNAAKFTSHGEVSLDVRLLAKEVDRYHILFTIKDTGIGMSEEHMNKLFTPFEQGDSSINRRFGGSGLGLPIVKNLLEIMGGDIRVYSTPGEGTTIIIHLSLNVDEEKEAVNKKVLSANHFRDVRTLVLEKSGANINLIESYLASYGMNCELTSSESSALSMLEAANGKFAKPFDLFIIDYDTPVEGGFKFIEAIRNNNKIYKIPKFMMLLPMMREDLFDRLNEYGVDIGIEKPIIPSILLNGIFDIFNLKVVSASQPSSTKDFAPINHEKPYHVLVVEDNKTNQLIVKSLLEQVGINSIIANNGKEGVEQYLDHSDRIDLILMDLHMPVMNGYEAAEKIRKLSPSVPIIAMTADAVLGVRDKCQQSGIYHYISKPFNPEYFIQTVKDIILDNESDLDEVVLDRQLGLKNMGGNIDLFHQVLKEYHKENLDTLDKLEAAVYEKRYDEAIQIVHKVKSSSGSIGAKTLHDVAISLQIALHEKKEDEILELHKKLSKLLGKFLEEVE
jgi:two-component system sensor histidine kinase/response regulator